MKIRKVPLTVVLDFYFLGGKLEPGMLVLILFLIIVTTAMLVLIALGKGMSAAFTGLFGLLVVLGYFIYSYKEITNQLERKR